MPVRIPTRPLDFSASKAANLISGEVHMLEDGDFRTIIPTYGAYYVKNLIVRDNANGQLIPETDYRPILYYEEPSRRSGYEVCSGILITNSIYSAVELQYQAVGGEFETIAAILENLTENLQIVEDADVTWADLADKPDDFPPAPHLHKITDVYGFEYIANALERIRQALLYSDEARLNVVYNNLKDYTDEEIAELTESLAGQITFIGVSETVTLDSSANAYVENVGTAENVELRFSIPRGEPGEQGDPAIVQDEVAPADPEVLWLDLGDEAEDLTGLPDAREAPEGQWAVTDGAGLYKLIGQHKYQAALNLHNLEAWDAGYRYTGQSLNEMNSGHSWTLPETAGTIQLNTFGPLNTPMIQPNGNGIDAIRPDLHVMLFSPTIAIENRQRVYMEYTTRETAMSHHGPILFWADEDNCVYLDGQGENDRFEVYLRVDGNEQQIGNLRGFHADRMENCFKRIGVEAYRVGGEAMKIRLFDLSSYLTHEVIISTDDTDLVWDRLGYQIGIARFDNAWFSDIAIWNYSWS